MSIRPVVFAVGLLSARLAVDARGALAAVAPFALSSPGNGGFVNATPALSWGTSTGATSYTLTVTSTGGAPVVKSGLVTPSYTFAANEALSEARSPYTWRVTARDDSGNTLDSNTASFFVDTTPPAAFALTAPAAGAFGRATARFNWEIASDAGSGLSKYHFYVDGAPCGDPLVAAASPFPGSCNPADGSHTWAVSAEDLTGNIRWCSEAPGGVGGRQIKIDNTGPAAGGGGVFQIASANIPDQLGFPTDRMVNTGINVVPGDVISVASTGMWCFLSCTTGCYDTNGYVNPVNTPTQSCNNGSLIARVGGGGTQFRCIGKSATFTAGINDVGILELGSNSQLGCNDKTVTATVTGGRVFGLTSPAPDAILNQQSPTFSWQAATDQGSGGVTYSLVIDGVPTGATSTGLGTVITPATYTIPDRLADGAHTWRVRARDAAGNVTDSTTRAFTVDTTRPDPFRLRTPAAGACSMTPTPSLCWNGASDPSGIATYQLWIDGALAFSTSDNLITCGTPAAALAPGLHAWYAVAIDRARNARRSLETFQVLIDYTAPVAPTLSTPANGASSADPPMFTWGAATDVGGVVKYEIYVDGGIVATVGRKTLGWLLPADLTVTSHTWYVRAVDACNLGTSSATGTFTTVACSPDAAPHQCPGYNVGRCQPGTRTCVTAGSWSTCTGAVGPTAETCNGEDDNCDGVVDEGTNGCGGVCPLPVNVYTPCDGPDVDLCQEGVYLCTGLNSLECVETTPVNVEICNGRDDDCNGVIDDGPGCLASTPDGGTPVDGSASSDDGAGAGGAGELDASAPGAGGGAGELDASAPGAGGAGGRTTSMTPDGGADAKADGGGGKFTVGCSCATAPPTTEIAAPLALVALVVGFALADARRRRPRRADGRRGAG